MPLLAMQVNSDATQFGIIFAANLTTYEDVLHRCLNLKRFQHRRDPSMLDRARSLPITMAITMAIHSIHLDFIRYLSQARRFHIFFCWAVFLPTHFFCRSPLGSIPLLQTFGFFQSWMFAHLLLFRSHSSSLHCQTVFYCIYSRTTASSPTFGFFQSNEQSLRSAIFKWVATISSLCNLQMSCLIKMSVIVPTAALFQAYHHTFFVDRWSWPNPECHSIQMAKTLLLSWSARCSTWSSWRITLQLRTGFATAVTPLDYPSYSCQLSW